jgi:ribosomal protein S18 acetylase RimI-like enzyme
MTYMTIEHAARHAWPALEEERLPYGVLRFAHGYTKRANSLCLFNSGQPACNEVVNRCEHFFGDRKQPSIVRIPSFTNASKLDQHLQGCGYALTNPSTVMSRTLTSADVCSVKPISLSVTPWLDAYYEISGEALSERNYHALLLRKIPGEKLLGCLESATGEPAACAIAILFNNVLGIFGVVTNPAFRRQNYASQLLSALLSWGRMRRASHAYLQVGEENSSAINLYSKAGFRSLYRYWYREKVIC